MATNFYRSGRYPEPPTSPPDDDAPARVGPESSEPEGYEMTREDHWVEAGVAAVWAAFDARRAARGAA